MKAYKLDISDYSVALPGNPPQPYPVRNALATILTSPRLDLNATNLLRNHALALRIVDEPGGAVLLSEEDHARLTACRDQITGWSFDDAPLLQRIADAEEIEVDEVKK